MGIVNNMDSRYSRETVCASTEDEYGEEVLYSGWNPSITLVCPALSLQSARTGYHQGCDGDYQVSSLCAGAQRISLGKGIIKSPVQCSGSGISEQVLPFELTKVVGAAKFQQQFAAQGW